MMGVEITEKVMGFLKKWLMAVAAEWVLSDFGHKKKIQLEYGALHYGTLHVEPDFPRIFVDFRSFSDFFMSCICLNCAYFQNEPVFEITKIIFFWIA